MTKALVLGAGGPVGIAWESGLIAGLAEGGVVVSTADLIVGTSAGSFVGAQLACGKTPAQIAARDLGDSPAPRLMSGPPPDLSPLILKLMEAAAGKRPAPEVRAEIGAFAIQARTAPEQDFISRFAVGDAWPEKPFLCAAVDAADGSFMIWNRDSGIELARAVASSCAVPGIFPPISFRGHRYIDGGIRSGTNADLAKGHDRVLVVSVMLRGMPSFVREVFGKRFEKEIAGLRESGARVEIVEPDDAALEAFAGNLMDDARRGPSAAAGLAQGRREARRLADFWR